MCGIAGVVGGGPKAAEVVRRMTEPMVHRGPDSAGLHSSDRCSLGFRRLRVIDLATGEQPMPNEDGTVWVVMNGEIYNFRELRRELEARGHRFRTQSDTEVVVHAYEEHGAAFVERLWGMFALAVWDERSGELLLARDRLGKKPCYYAAVGGKLLFASELKALLSHPDCPRRLDRKALRLYLTYGYVPAPWSILEGVCKLPPASVLQVAVGEPPGPPRSYWSPSYTPKLRVTESEAEEQLLSLLDDAVRARLVSDVPLGALLSGGVDSSVIVALMARAGGTVRTFTIGFEEAGFDERPFARLVAERYCTEHCELVVRPDAAAVLPALARFLDEPMADSSALPTYYVSQQARREVTVVLNGDGGDESFGGYHHHRSLRLVAGAAELPGALRRRLLLPAARGLRAVTGTERASNLVSLLEQTEQPAWRRHAARMWMFDPVAVDALLGPGEPAPDPLEEAYAAADGLDPVDAMLRADLLTVLPGQLLVKMDRMSMAHALEARSPLLDHRVVELVAGLPAGLKIRGVERKYLLRRLARRLLPPELLERGKHGFSFPIARWMSDGKLGDAAREVLSDRSAHLRSWLDGRALDALAQERGDLSEAGAARRWTLLVLEHWAREVLEPPVAARASA